MGLLKLVTNQSPIVLWAVNNKGLFITSEGKGLETLGLQPNEVVGKSVYQLYADQPDILVDIGRAMSGESITSTVKLGPITFECHYSPLLNSQGRKVGVVGVAVDMTQHKQLEEQLLRSEQRSSLAQKAANIGIWEMDSYGCELYCSETIEQMWGLAPGQFDGRFDTAISHVDERDRQRVSDAVRHAMESQQRFQVEYRTKSTGRWIYTVGNVFRNQQQQPARWIGISMDITARKSAELALIESRADLAKSQEIAHIGNWALEWGKGFSYWSDEMCRIHGLEQGKSPHIEDYFDTLIHPDDRERIREEYARFAQGCPRYSIEFRVVRPDGSVRYVWGESNIQCDEQGQPVRGLGIVQDITERKLAEEKLRASEQELASILNNIQDTYFRTDSAGVIIKLSPSVKNLAGFERHELLGGSLGDIYVDRRAYDKFLAGLADLNGKVVSYESDLRRKNGAVVWVSVNAQYWYNDAGEVMGVEGIARDITEQKHAEVQMLKLSSALEQAADLVIITGKDGVIEYVNQAFEITTGYSREQVIGKKPSLIKSGQHDGKFYERLWNKILRGEVFTDVIINRRRDGSIYYEEKSITPLRDKRGNIIHFISTGKDITERMQIQARLEFQAHHDALTQLPNRVLFTDRLNHALARRGRGAIKLALMFLDIDRFKNINDTLGHETGDRVLKAVAKRLQSVLREGDTVARFGGDEFAILLEEIESVELITTVARKILLQLAKPLSIDRREWFVTTSIGISLNPGDGEDAQTLLKHADIAMYRAKDLGRNTYQFYASDMSTKAFERLSLESELHRAIERHEFVVHYQPQVTMQTGHVVCVEALLRWHHPELGMVMPGNFISVLEETGLIVPVGELVLRSACEQGVAWCKSGMPSMRIAVNLSSRHLQSPTMVDSVESIVQETGFDPCQLELEITESVILQNNKTVLRNFHRLGDMGVRLALDDFGTGYSSLSYIKRFPIDTVKIDGSFIRGIGTDEDDVAIIQAIIAMAKSLNLLSVAEGVETHAQLAFLARQRCDLVQGYYFSTPVRPEGIEQFVQGATASESIQ